MKSRHPTNAMLSQCRHPDGQRGIVLFIALIALVVLSLAAVALIRSVDTNTVIAGNVAFKQAATASADSGLETAIASIKAREAAVANAGKNIFTDATHTLNADDAANGYYSNADDATLPLAADATWAAGSSVPAAGDGIDANGTDASGNTTRYVIQRMCRTANQVLSTANCLFGNAELDTSGKTVPLPEDVCSGPGCPAAGQSPQYRVTARVTGPKNTVSYIQAFVY